MDKKSKIILLVFSLMVLSSVGIAYYKFSISKDYLVKVEVECDPSKVACFVYECDPESEECSENPEENTSYYKLITKRAFLLPNCNFEDETCLSVECLDGEECEELLCDIETVEADVICNDPATFLNNTVFFSLHAYQRWARFFICLL